MSSLFDAGRHVIRNTLVIVGALVLGGVLAALAVMYSGVFNVAATVADSEALKWMLITVREASVDLHSRDVPSPETAADRDNGFRIFRQQCAMCHTPPGRPPDPMALGFNPPAPSFGADADEMSAAGLFWVTKNGIRFTGMPAWGPSLSDKEIWDVVEFMKTLPAMTAADYDAMDASLPGTPLKQ